MNQKFKDIFADCTHFLSDEKYLRLIYRLKMHKKLNLKNPKTFNEKINWLKLNDRKDIYSLMVDKYDAKTFFEKYVSSEHIIKTIGIYDDFDKIDFKKLPQQFVIKTTHDSGSFFICKDKDNFDIEKCRKSLTKKMKKNLYWRTREWPYKNIKPRIIIEEYVSLEGSKGCPEYKIFCSNGKAKLVLVCRGEAHGDGRSNDFFDKDFNHIPVDSAYKQYKGIIEKPVYYNEILSVAEKLSQNIPILRVDFYCLESTYYIGETTFYHCGGLCRFTPDEYDLKFGELFDI